MIGIRSMQQRRIEHEWRERRVLKFEEKRGKKKKKTKRTRPQWYSLLWFHHRRVDSIWVRIIKDCLSFSRRENTSCKYPPIPFPACALLCLSSRGSIPFRSQLFPTSLEEEPEKLQGAIESCPSTSSFSFVHGFPTPLLILSPRSFFVSLPRSFAAVCVCSVLPSASRGMSPPTPPLFLLAPPSFSNWKRFRATRHPGNRAKPVISKRKKKVFSVTGLFHRLNRCRVSFRSPPPLRSVLRSFGHVVKRWNARRGARENDSFIPWLPSCLARQCYFVDLNRHRAG